MRMSESTIIVIKLRVIIEANRFDLALGIVQSIRENLNKQVRMRTQQLRLTPTRQNPSILTRMKKRKNIVGLRKQKKQRL